METGDVPSSEAGSQQAKRKTFGPTANPTRKKTKLSESELKKELSEIKNLRRGYLTSKEKLTILHAYFSLKKEALVGEDTLFPLEGTVISTAPSLPSTTSSSSTSSTALPAPLVPSSSSLPTPKMASNDVALKKQKNRDFSESVASLLGYSKRTVNDIYAKWRKGDHTSILEDSGVAKAKAKGRPMHISNSSQDVSVVRLFLLEHRANMQGVIAKDVLDLMVEKGIFPKENGTKKGENGGASTNNPRGNPAALRKVQRWLKQNNFSMERWPSGRRSFCESESIERERAVYLRKLMANRSRSGDSRLREVYIGELLVPFTDGDTTKKGSKPNSTPPTSTSTTITTTTATITAATTSSRSLPNDTESASVASVPLSIASKPPPPLPQPGKGGGRLRAVLIGKRATASAPSSSNTDEKAEESNADGASVLLTPMGEAISSDTSTFKTQEETDEVSEFQSWFEGELLPSLPSGEQCLIILEPTRVHKAFASPGIDLNCSKKSDLLKYLREQGVAFASDATALELRLAARRHFLRKRVLWVERIATDRGHQVVFLPPYHTELQPWTALSAVVADASASKQTTSSTETVRSLLDDKVVGRVLSTLSTLEKDYHDLVLRVDKTEDLEELPPTRVVMEFDCDSDGDSSFE